jgi:uncharacterized OB-fold protein
MADPVQFMSHHTAVEYRVPDPSPLNVYFAEQLAAGRIVGHKCPECGKVYMPPRGYCPLCVVATTAKDEVDVSDHGTVTTFSIITPLQYQGQEETDDYVQATILLDGSDTTIMVAHLDGVAIADVHSGLRVQAVWAPEAERKGATGSLARQMGLGSAVTSWEATGEPDTPREQLGENII